MGAASTPWWWRHAWHPMRLASQVARSSRRNSVHEYLRTVAEEPFPPICVHSCAPMSVHNGATVYTNAPKWLREAVFANLCTLLRHRPGGEGFFSNDTANTEIYTSSRSLVKVLRFAGRLGAMAATLPFGVTCLFDGP